MRTLALFILAFLFCLPAGVAFAVELGGGTNTNDSTLTGGTNNGASGQNVPLINPLKGGGTLESFLNSILAFAIRIGTIAVILMLVFVGYKFVAAQGNPGKITEAQNMLLWTVIGALILLGAVVIKDGILATVQALSTGN